MHAHQAIPPQTQIRALPQMSGRVFMTDGGLETTLVFHDGIDLPYFAAFDLLRGEEGYRRLKDYFRRYAAMASEHRMGLLLESVTWRASRDWGEKLGYGLDALREANRSAIRLLQEVAEEFRSEHTPVVISGCIGPRGDGYRPGTEMSAAEAEEYHREQIRSLRDAGADLVSAYTLPTVAEAIGITRAARSLDIPVVISFTVETDGRLPGGEALGEAIEAVDAATQSGPAYYMINCAHPSHFRHALAAGDTWVGRIRGLRANASTKSHAELDEAEELDEGNPEQLGLEYREMMGLLQNLAVVGGCCGTDHRHVAAICEACHSSG